MNVFLSKLKRWAKLKVMPISYLFMSEPLPQKWVFIVGCYNSGTTLLHNLLATHPLIGSMPNEGQFFSGQLPRGADYNLPRLWALQPDLFYLDDSSKTSIDPIKLRKEWAFFYDKTDRPVLVEKTILNAARTRWLQANFPNAYFISIFRNGYAVSEGIHRKEKHSLEKAATQWTVSNEVLLNDIPFLKHHLMLSYEELVASPAVTMKKVTSFLEISDLPDRTFDQDFTIHKVSDKIRDNNNESIAKLNPEQIAMINQIARKVLERLNYPIR